MTFTLGDDAGIAFEHLDDTQADDWTFREFGRGAYLLALAYLDPGNPAADVRLREYRAENA